MKKIVDPFVDFLPTIDLHGEFEDIAIVMVEQFIQDNIKLKNHKIVVIHGKGMQILSKAIRNYAKYHKQIESYELSVYNDGITILNLKKQAK